MIYNTETKFFYNININESYIDDDEIRKYRKEEIPEELKSYAEILLHYYQKRIKIKNNSEVSDEKSPIEEQNSSSQSTQKREINLLSSEYSNSIISQNRVTDKSSLIYVRKIIVYKEVSILILSDQTIESIFADKIKILICYLIELFLLKKFIVD